jgi:membrane protease subunit HflK
MKIVDLYPDGEDGSYSFDPKNWWNGSDFKRYGWIVILIILVIYLLSGIYIVNPDERAVVKRFGAYITEKGEGIHYHFPWPIESILRNKVTEIKRIEIGFRTIDPGPPAHYQDVAAESLMLTGDENIISVDMVVQYKIKSLKNYLFNVENPDISLKKAAESSIRQIIGKTTFDVAITTGKNEIQIKTQELLQKISDLYKLGIMIVNVKLQDVHPPVEVMSAFKDVSSAREDSNRYINEGKSYYNQVVPSAEGKAYEIIEQAKAYKEAIINNAQGEANKFLKIYQMYKKYPHITRTRLYFEMIEAVMKKANWWVLDDALVKSFAFLRKSLGFEGRKENGNSR